MGSLRGGEGIRMLGQRSLRDAWSRLFRETVNCDKHIESQVHWFGERRGNMNAWSTFSERLTLYGDKDISERVTL